jgi:hypothetical protein
MSIDCPFTVNVCGMDVVTFLTVMEDPLLTLKVAGTKVRLVVCCRVRALFPLTEVVPEDVLPPPPPYPYPWPPPPLEELDPPPPPPGDVVPLPPQAAPTTITAMATTTSSIHRLVPMFRSSSTL